MDGKWKCRGCGGICYGLEGHNRCRGCTDLDQRKAVAAAYESGRLAGQEAMRERCAVLVDRAAEEACSCDGTLCGPDDVAPHDADCLAFDLDDLAYAIRALEVPHD